MSFSEFKGIWTVNWAIGGEKVPHRVAIGGNPDAVMILCIDDEGGHPFPDPIQCKYNPDPERIEIQNGDTTYLISLARGVTVNRITCAVKPPNTEPIPPYGAGSWTADDNVGGAGGGDGGDEGHR